MKRAHLELNINFEEFYIMKILFYEVTCHDMNLFEISYLKLLNEIERSRYEITASNFFNICYYDKELQNRM